MLTAPRGLVAALGALAFTASTGAGVAFANDPSDDPRADRRARMLERFDADGDGQLSEDERRSAREARRAQSPERFQRREQRALQRFDTDGDGQLSDDERSAARASREQRALERFDADGDGQLSDDERAAARDQRRGHRGPPRDRGGRPPRY